MPRMPSSERVNWQPISQMPLVASMIDGALSDTADHLQALTKARAQPHVLDEGTIDRIMAMSDLELCLQALLGTLPPGRSQPDPRHCVQYATVHFYADGPSTPSGSSLPEHLAVHGNAPLLRTSAKGRTDAFVEWCGYGRTRRNPSVPGPTKNGSKGSDLAHSPSRRRMTGNCACQTAVAHILQRDGETAPASRLMGGLLTSPSSKTADASRSRSK